MERGKGCDSATFQTEVDRGIEQDGSLLLWAGAITCVGVVAGVFSAWRRWIGFRESRWTESSLRERLFTHLQGLHIGYHDMAQTGQLMSRASSDLGQIQGFVVMIPLTISNVAMVAAVMVILLSSQPMLAVIALAPLPFVNLAARRFSNSIHPAILAVQAEQAELANVVEESVSGIRVVKGFGAEATQMRKLEKKRTIFVVCRWWQQKFAASFCQASTSCPPLASLPFLVLAATASLAVK